MLTVSLCASGQFVDAGVSIGGANYLGDIGGKYDAKHTFQDMRIQDTRWFFGAYARYKKNKAWSFSMTTSVSRLRAWDSKTSNPERRARNMNFRTDVWETAARMERTILYDNDVPNLGYYNPTMRMYVFAGVALVRFDPKGTMPDGSLVRLRTLETEGVRYSKYAFSIPAGIGVVFTYSDKWKFGMELAWRWTTTDRIDDVSDRYAAPKSKAAAEFTQRTDQALIDEINADTGSNLNVNSFRYVPGARQQAPRGNPLNKDSYTTMCVTVGRVIKKADVEKITRKARRRTRARF